MGPPRRRCAPAAHRPAVLPAHHPTTRTVLCMGPSIPPLTGWRRRAFGLLVGLGALAGVLAITWGLTAHSSSDPDRRPDRPAGLESGTPAASDAPIRLLYAAGRGPTDDATLHCTPPRRATGYLAGRDLTAACAALPAALVPPAPDQLCTELYGGPERLTITVPAATATAPVRSVALTRTDGCAVARFEAARALLPVGARTTTGPGRAG